MYDHAKVSLGGTMTHCRPARTIKGEIGLIFSAFFLFCSEMTVVAIKLSLIGVPMCLPAF